MPDEKKESDPAGRTVPDGAGEQKAGENPQNLQGPPGTTAPPDVSGPPPGGSSGAGKSKKKKRAILFLIVTFVLLVFLVLLNSLDFEAISEKLKGDSDNSPQETVQNYPAIWFDPPDYDEDLTADADYMGLDRNMEYTEGNESFVIVGDASVHGDLCVFWQNYLDALVAGDAETLKAMHTDRYFELMKQNGEFLDGFEKGYAPQKIYNFRVKLEETYDLGENGDKNGNYKGYIVHYFRVSYQIKDNNGTFRRDMNADGDAVPLRFEVLERGGDIRINSQNRYLVPKAGTEKGVNFMMYIWIALILIAIVTELLTTSLVAVWFIPSGIVSLVLSVIWPDRIVMQIITYVAVSALFLILTRPLVKRHFQKGAYLPTNADMVIGKIAVVTETIDNVAQTGEVRVDGKRWSAVSADGGVIAVDAPVLVEKIQGVKLICSPAPKDEKTD